MAKILIQGDKNFSSQFEKLLEKRESIDLNIDKVVDNIIKQIKKDGDKALIKLTNKFDKNNVKRISELVVKKK